MFVYFRVRVPNIENQTQTFRVVFVSCFRVVYRIVRSKQNPVFLELKEARQSTRLGVLFFFRLIIKLSTHFTPIDYPGHSRIFDLIWNTVFRNYISLKNKTLNSKTNRQFEKCYSWVFDRIGCRDYVGTINLIFTFKKWVKLMVEEICYEKP